MTMITDLCNMVSITSLFLMENKLISASMLKEQFNLSDEETEQLLRHMRTIKLNYEGRVSIPFGEVGVDTRKDKRSSGFTRHRD